jgi:hypothetical protein
MDQTTLSEGLSRQEFLRSLQESKLLPSADVDRATTANPAADGLALASALVDSGQLTPYQVDMFTRHRAAELLPASLNRSGGLVSPCVTRACRREWFERSLKNGLRN